MTPTSRHPLHKRVIHPVIAWAIILSASMVSFIPTMILAQTTFDTATQPQFVTPPMPPANECAMKCEALKQQCAASAGSDLEAQRKCSESAGQCFGSCQQTEPGLTPPPMPPPMPPQGQPSSECSNKCNASMQECLKTAGGSPEAEMKCKESTGPCFASCGGGQPGGFQGGEQGGMMDGPNRFDGNQGGPNEEQMKAMQQMGFKNMKRQIGNFARQLTKIKTRIAALDKKGIKAPQELIDAIAKADELIAKVNAATSFDDLEDAENIGEVLREAGETVQENMPNLERLAALPKIYGRIDKQIKTFERQLASDKKIAATSKIDLSSAIGDFETALNNVKAAYAEAKAKLAAGDEDGFDMLQTDVFEGFAEVGQFHAAIQQIRQLQTSLRQGARQLTQFQNDLNRLKRQKKNTDEAQATLNEAKTRFEELKAAATAKPLDTEKIFDLIDNLEDLRATFMEQLSDLKGIKHQDEIDSGLSVPSLDLSGFGGMIGPKPEMEDEGEKLPPVGPLSVQAETGELGGTKGSLTLIGETSTTPDTHGGYLYLGDGGATAAYTVQAPAAGIYSLWFRTSDDGLHSDGARTASVTVNGGKQVWNHKSQNTNGWLYVKLDQVTLKKGANAVVFSKVASSSAAFVMDDFILSNDASFQPK